MKASKTLRLSTAFLGCLSVCSAAGQEVYYMGLERGDFSTGRDDYREEPRASSLSLGVAENHYTIQLTEYDFDDVVPGADDTTYRRLEGRSLQLGREFRLTDKLNIEFAYGRLWWDVRDFQNDVFIEKQSGADRLLEAQLSVYFGRVRLYVSRKEMRNVADDDIETTMFGARYFFK